MSEREILKLHPADKGWIRVETPNGRNFVSRVKVCGITVELEQGKAELEVESDGWSIDSEYDPWLLVEAPDWYTPEE